MSIFRRKKNDFEFRGSIEDIAAQYDARRKRLIYLRKPFLVLLAILIVGVGWYVFSADDKASRSQAAEVFEENNHELGSLLEEMAEDAVYLEDFDLGDHKPFEYEVEGGDTLSGIAKKFNLKLNTVLWANNLNEKSVIKPGQTIMLLPTDGVLHKIEKGETLSEIAKLYSGDLEKTIAYNDLEDPSLVHIGDIIIIPDGQVVPGQSAKPAPGGKSNPAAVGKLVWPTTTRNMTQGYHAAHRGIDLANGSRPPVFASHDGVVEFSGKDGPWGFTVVIRGAKGLATRYSHNTENYVKKGQKVSAGKTIAKVGNTGNVRGKTGLHLDFRIYRNGVAVNPLPYLR